MGPLALRLFMFTFIYREQRMTQVILAGLLWAVTGLLALASLLPFSKVPFGAIRGLDFPRQQFFGLAILLAPAFPLVQSGTALIWGLCILALVALCQGAHIVKFTPLWRRQSVRASEVLRADARRRISLLAANVKMSNRAYDRLIKLVRARQPDVVMAIEVDQAWIDALREGLGAEYPEWITVPQDNGYGLCVMSKLPLSESDTRQLITKDVPSVRTAITLRGGKTLRLYVVHPEPPVIDHDTIGRDGEIALVGMQAAKDPLPAIVSGDLNDVAWSTTTRRFQRLSVLLDPRVGRGFYNTFSATMPWMRWPLDHLFHDPQFRLVEMKRLEKIGSDHFPMWFVLALAETQAQASDPGTADAAETEEIKDAIRAEQKRDRDPIGGDWESQ